MRNFKKFLSLVMATLMILSVAVITTGAADTTADYTDAAQHLVALKIMKGDNGNLMLDQGVTRYQAALFFVQTVSGETDAAVWNAQKTSAYFKDVVEYGTAIDYAYGRKLVVGRGNGIFGYNDPITYQDMLVMAVRALGYETEDMSYPYGYILAAQKLGLTDDVAKTVNYTAPLTRGATAQIMWNMLNTEIAVVDPLTDKILYPGEKGLTDAIINDPAKTITRVSLLEDAGYASGKINATITAFNEGDDDKVSTVTLKCSYTDKDNNEVSLGNIDVAVADLGITDKTPKVNYLGLDVTLLVDVDATEFNDKYDVDADESEATVVYADFVAYTTVENLGNAGNIRYNDEDKVLTLDGTKYSEDKYEIEVYTFTEKANQGWVADATAELKAAFKYDSKDGYVGTNSYGKVAYRVIEDGYTDNHGTPEDTKDDIVKDVVEILYTPYLFGQYVSRTIRYSYTSKDADFVSIGAYDGSEFVEKLVGSTKTVDDETTSVTKSQGEKAMSVTVEGESVKSGDFVFYKYNSLDNILTIAQNGGAFKEGRLTGSNGKLETVKIDGVNKDTGFKGAFTDADMADTYAPAKLKGYIGALEAGKNNVKYIEVDGSVVYMAETTSKNNNEENTFDYVIATVWSDKMADLLDYDTAAEYDKACTKGVYLDDDGYVAIAVLNTATGKWELASLRNFYSGAFDADKEKYDDKMDLGETAKYYDMVGETYGKKIPFNANVADLKESAIFLVVNEENGVYDLAAAPDKYNAYKDGDKTMPNLVAGVSDDGLVFSDSVAKTNKIQATNDAEDAARVTLNGSTVIVVVDGNKAYVRTGVQKASKSVNTTAGAMILSANSSLIVMDVTDATMDKAVLENWGAKVGASTDTTYYVVLADHSADVDNDGDNVVVTLTNLFDLKTMKAVESVKVTVADMEEAGKLDYDPGDVLKLNDEGEIKLSTLTVAEAALELLDDEEYKIVADAKLKDMTFDDADSVGLVIDASDSKNGTVDANKATDVSIKVVTLDVTGLDKKDYDYDGAIVKDASVEADKYKDVSLQEVAGTDYYTYTIGADEVVTTNEPSVGVFDNFVIDMNGKTIIIPESDYDYADAKALSDVKGVEVTVELTAYATYNSTKGTLDMTVFKIVY